MRVTGRFLVTMTRGYEGSGAGSSSLTSSRTILNAGGTETCDQHYVRIRMVTEAIACHETGHAVGLTHPTEASPASGAADAAFRCMRNFQPSGSILGPHNVEQINANYS